MVREQVPKGDLLINSTINFRRSISDLARFSESIVGRWALLSGIVMLK